MDKIVNLKDLLVEQIRDLYNAEKIQLIELPQIAEKASTRDLRLAINHHLEETKEQVVRLDKVAKKLGIVPVGEECEVMRGMIMDTWNLINRSTDHEISDAAIVTSVQHINHYEIAGYGTASSYAKALGLNEISELLHETLEEEKKIDERLSLLAEEFINIQAKVPMST